MIDAIFAVGSVLFIIGIWPAVRGPHKPPPSTCWITGLVLVSYTACYASLGYTYSMITTGILAALWLRCAVAPRGLPAISDAEVVKRCPEGMEMFKDGFDNLLYVHSRANCAGGSCPVHAPSQHHMLDWPLLWRGDRGIFERVCEHGVGHPDPDTVAYFRLANADVSAVTVHGCDLCCVPPQAHG